jgi:hypothetical protein
VASQSARSRLAAHLRYDETFVKLDGAWLFAERKLYVDWIETKALKPKLPIRSRT